MPPTTLLRQSRRSSEFLITIPLASAIAVSCSRPSIYRATLLLFGQWPLFPNFRNGLVTSPSLLQLTIVNEHNTSVLSPYLCLRSLAEVGQPNNSSLSYRVIICIYHVDRFTCDFNNSKNNRNVPIIFKKKRFKKIKLRYIYYSSFYDWGMNENTKNDMSKRKRNGIEQ